MSKFFENKQIIHIITEIVILIGITLYFSSKNKKLYEHIEDLSQRLEDQEDLIQKHEQIIRQLVQRLNSSRGSGNSPQHTIPTPTPKTVSTPVSKSKRNSANIKRISKSTTQMPKHQITKPQVNFMENTFIEENNQSDEENTFNQENNQSDESSEDEGDIDAEIADELGELQEQDGLKKRI